MLNPSQSRESLPGQGRLSEERECEPKSLLGLENSKAERKRKRGQVEGFQCVHEWHTEQLYE